MTAQRNQQNAGNRISIIKIGGKGIGQNGENINNILNRIMTIKERDKYGPVVVVSAPEGITDLAIEVGNSYADPKIARMDPSCLFLPYNNIANGYIKGEYKEELSNELKKCEEVVLKTLELVEPNNFVDRFRARILGHSGEIPTSVAIDYVFRSHKIDSDHIKIENWPIVTDNNFESANFLIEESSKKLKYLLDPLEQRKVIIIGGFIGVTTEGIETTFSRGGSDRTAADLGILLNECFDVIVDFEKDDMVRSADPKTKGINRKELDEVLHLSYNEARLAGQFGMKIVAPSAIIDIQESGLDIPIYITDIKNPDRYTIIGKEVKGEDENPIKIITGKEDCAILELDKTKRDSLEDYLRCTKKYYDFLELSPYDKDGGSLARFLLLDGEFVRYNEKDILGFDQNSTIEYGLGAIILVGDKMAKVPGVAGKAHGALEENNINILDGFVQRPTSRVVVIVKEGNLEKSVKAIHSKR